MTKYTPAFMERPARTSLLERVFPCAACKNNHASSRSTILKILRSEWIKSKAKVEMPQLPCHVSSDRGVTTERHQNLRFIFKPCAKRQFVAEYETRIRYHDKSCFIQKRFTVRIWKKQRTKRTLKSLMFVFLYCVQR